MKRVLCDAIVDRLGPDQYQVTVTGKEAHAGNVKVYTIKKKTEDNAAREGIARFVAEMRGDA